MSRRDDTLDPGLSAELEQLEAALGDDVRALRAEPTPAFRTALDRRVAGGFARPRRRVPRLVRWAPAAAVAAAALAALVVALGSGGASSQDSASRGSGATAAPSSAGADAAAAPSRRSVERSAALRLEVPARRVQAAADGVVRATQAVGGYVQSSHVSTAGTGGGDFVLRVPTPRLDDALAALGRLGHVRGLEQSSQDITASVNSAAARLADARAERRGLLRALGRATSANELTALRARLRDNRVRLAAAEASARAARRRAALSTVALTLTGTGRQAAVPGSGGPWTPRDAAGDALRVLEVGAGVALVALAVALLLAIPGALAWLAGRGVRRRRREAALGAG